tara:strand:- start:22668 stop:24320 length:1653 start_codon:yes stop_codon:yes gene_type:complete
MAVSISGEGVISGSSNYSFDSKVSVGGTLTYEDVSSVDSVGIITARSGIHIDDSIVHIGDTDTKIRFPAADTITAETGGTERLRIDSSGRLLLGTTSLISSSVAANLQVASDFGSRLNIARSDTTTAADNLIGAFDFYGNDSNGTYQNCARILAEADLDHDTDDKPTRLTFYTAPDGSATPSERLRITSGGDVGIGDNAPNSNYGTNLSVHSTATDGARLKISDGTTGKGNTDGLDIISTGGAAYIMNRYAGAMHLATSNINRINITSAGNVGINESSPGGLLQVGASSGSHVIITPNTGIDVNDGAINLYQATSNANATPFIISSDVGGTETEKLRITAAGKVGINQATPTQALDVVGRIIKTEYNPGELIECIETIANGVSITTSTGTHTIQNVTGTQDLTTSYLIIEGSQITYSIPVGAKRLIYEFWCFMRDKDVGPLLHFQGSVTADGTSAFPTYVETSRHTWRGSTANADYQQWIHNQMVLFNTTSGEDQAGGYLNSLGGTTRTFRFHCREYSGTYEAQLHTTNNWDGSGTDILVRPQIRIAVYA